MKRILLLLLALSIGANVGFVVRALRAPSAAGRPAPPPGMPNRPSIERTMNHHLERMTEDLELDTEQQASLRKAHASLLPSIQEAHQDIERLRDMVARTFVEEIDTPDVFRVRVRQLQQSQARFDSLLTEVLLAEIAVLDPDQRAHYIGVSPWNRRYKESPPGGPRNRRYKESPPGGPPHGALPPDPPPPPR